MSRNFEPGAKVQHSSNPQVMTVEKYDDDDGQVICSWIVKGKVQRASFPEAVLVPYKPSFPVYSNPRPPMFPMKQR